MSSIPPQKLISWSAAIALSAGFSSASTNQNGGESESHDDFKPQYKGGTPPSISKQIEEDVAAHSVFVYMKGVPEAPMCGFSNMACRILDAYGGLFAFLFSLCQCSVFGFQLSSLGAW